MKSVPSSCDSNLWFSTPSAASAGAMADAEANSANSCRACAVRSRRPARIFCSASPENPPVAISPSTRSEIAFHCTRARSCRFRTYSDVTSLRLVSACAISEASRRLRCASSTWVLVHQTASAMSPIVASNAAVASRSLLAIFTLASTPDRHALGLNSEQCIEVKVREEIGDGSLFSVSACHRPARLVFQGVELRLLQVHLELEFIPDWGKRFGVHIQSRRDELQRVPRLGPVEPFCFEQRPHELFDRLRLLFEEVTPADQHVQLRVYVGLRQRHR